MSKQIVLTLISKPGCHLCDEARNAIESTMLKFFTDVNPDIAIEFNEVNMLDYEDLIEKYSEEIPVLQINGQVHAYWRIDEDRLLKALEQLS